MALVDRRSWQASLAEEVFHLLDMLEGFRCDPSGFTGLPRHHNDSSHVRPYEKTLDGLPRDLAVLATVSQDLYSQLEEVDKALAVISTSRVPIAVAQQRGWAKLRDQCVDLVRSVNSCNFMGAYDDDDDDDRCGRNWKLELAFVIDDLPDQISAIRSVTNSLLRQEESRATDKLSGWNITHERPPVAIIAGEEYELDSHVLRNIHESILEWLSFPLMHKGAGPSFVPEPSSCEWIFNSEFLRWVRSTTQPDGCFGLIGPPGSGKSTLIRFLSQSPRLTASLRLWDVPGDLCVVAFHFRRVSGTSEPSSLAGLLRHLLYLLLRKHAMLIATVLPAQFHEACNRQGGKSGGEQTVFQQPSLVPLLEAFKTLVSQQQIPLKVVILTDGLDECEDLERLAEFVKMAATMSNVRMAITSQNPPGSVFLASSSTTLDLAGYNEGAIRAFVAGRLGTAGRTINTESTAPAVPGELIECIVQASRGVFLWARIATNRISKLVASGGETDVEKLQKAVEEFPKDLDGVYRDVLQGDVETVARLLQTHTHCLTRFSNASVAQRRLSLLDLYLAWCPQDMETLLQPLGEIVSSGISSKRAPNFAAAMTVDFREKLSVLALIRGTDFDDGLLGLIAIHGPLHWGQATCSTQATVDFDHGTLRDYTLNQSWTNAEACEQLLRGVSTRLLYTLDSLLDQPLSRDTLWEFADRILAYATCLEALGHADSGRDCVDYMYASRLNLIDGCLQRAHQASLQVRRSEWSEKTYLLGNLTHSDKGREARYHGSRHWSHFHADEPEAFDAHNSFVTVAIQSGLVRYVGLQLGPNSFLGESSPVFFEAFPSHWPRSYAEYRKTLLFGGTAKEVLARVGRRLFSWPRVAPLYVLGGNRPLIDYALCPSLQFRHQNINKDMVKLLLDHGADLNKRFRGLTCWERGLIWQHKYFTMTPARGPSAADDVSVVARNRLEILKLILDPKVVKTELKTPTSIEGVPRTDSLDQCFAKFDQAGLEEVKDLLKARQEESKRRSFFFGSKKKSAVSSSTQTGTT